MAAPRESPERQHAFATKSVDELAGHTEHARRFGRRDLLGRTQDHYWPAGGNVLEHVSQRVTELGIVINLSGK